MKLLCLVALAVCAVAHGDIFQADILPPGLSVTKNLEGSQYDLHIPALNIEEISDEIPPEYEGKTEVDNRIITGAIENALESFRDVVINGSDDLPVLDPLEIPELGPFQYRMTGIRAEGSVHDLRMEGLRWFVADRITMNPLRLTVGITVTVPWLIITGGYDTHARIGLINHRAGGNFRIFVHRIEVAVDMRMGTNIFAGHLVLRSLDIKLDIHDTQISITGMTGSSILNSLISSTIQSVSQSMIQNELENISQTLSEELFDVINEVLKGYSVSDIFG